jgi:putative MFS transporter
VFSVIGIVLGAAYPMASSPETLVATGFAITGCIYVLSSLSIATYVPELFQTTLRMRGAGLCNAIGRAVSMAVPYVVVWAFEAFGIVGVVTLIGGTLLAQAVIVALFGPEIRRRSLEELETHA